jgi:hypothetical protein
MRRTYGGQIKIYGEKWNAQGGLCAICRLPETRVVNGRVAMLCWDHNHRTGEMRQLLCTTCNTGLGAFKDDIGRLSGAILYLLADSQAGMPRRIIEALASLAPHQTVNWRNE